MGTRGAVGFFYKGETKVAYNHFDSYPESLGERVLAFVRDMNEDSVKRRVEQLQRVESGEGVPDAPTLTKLVMLGFSEEPAPASEKPTWYQLLRATQGRLDLILQSGYYLDALNFFGDSLFCEWGYVVNLDDRVVEIYRGFQEEPHQKGRYATMPFEGDYHPVALVKCLSFDRLPPEGALDSVVQESPVEELAREGVVR